MEDLTAPVPLYFFPGNFGDALAPYIVEKLTGRTPSETLAKEHMKSVPNIWKPNFDRTQLKPGYMVIGSICFLAGPTTKIWGCGTLNVRYRVARGAQFSAVRGPLTRIWLESQGFNVPEIYGDPALLLPNIYDKPVEIEHEIGIIPHYNHTELCAERFPDAYTIDLRRHHGRHLYPKIENTIDAIRSCKRIVSTSLHGIITAHAYGIPAVWATFSRSKKRLLGGKWKLFKFQDYFLSVRMLPPKAPIDLSDTSLSIDDLIAACPESVNLDIDLDRLLNACPIPKAAPAK